MKKIKSYFITGFAILLPLVLTILVAKILISLLSRPFSGVIHDLLSKYNISSQMVDVYSQLIGIILFFVVVLIIGSLGRWYIVHKLFQLIEYVFHRIPLVSKIYKALKDVAENLFHQDTMAFQTVVLVEFPCQGIYSMGLITTDAMLHHEKGIEEYVSVFVPGIPNPTVGFVMLYKRSDILTTTLSVRESLQILLSCSAKYDKFTLISKKS